MLPRKARKYTPWLQFLITCSMQSTGESLGVRLWDSHQFLGFCDKLAYFYRRQYTYQGQEHDWSTIKSGYKCVHVEYALCDWLWSVAWGERGTGGRGEGRLVPVAPCSGAGPPGMPQLRRDGHHSWHQPNVYQGCLNYVRWGVTLLMYFWLGSRVFLFVFFDV